MANREISEAELRAMLKPRRTPPQPVRKSRQWVVTDRDIAAFAKLLREKFPTMVFLRRKDADEQETEWHVLHCPACSGGYVYAVLPSEGWEAEAFCARPPHLRGSFPDTHFWMFGSRTPSFRTQKSGRVIEEREVSFMQGWHLRSDRETARFLRRVWRLSEKLATSRVKLIDAETGGTVHPELDRQWYGFDALAWCQQRLDRVLDGNCRPTDDWRMPDLPWYERRRRAVEHDVAAYWAGIDTLRDRIPLFSWPIGYRRSDGAMVTANDIGLDVEQLIPVAELDRARLAALVRKRWEAGEWKEFWRLGERMTLEKGIAELETEAADRRWSDFHRGVFDLEWAIELIRTAPEFSQYLKPKR